MTLLLILFNIIAIITAFCCVAILFSVFIDFVEFGNKGGEKQKKKSIVATGSMFAFFVMFYCFIRFSVGRFNIENDYIVICLNFLGLFLVVAGTFVNIMGRFNLGKNWANHIKIYSDHKLVTAGMYKIVRHPLYGSLIWAFYGAGFVYLNYGAILLNTFVFIPFMYYRAKQEEKLLEKEFPGYNEYRLHTGMFFPKIKL